MSYKIYFLLYLLPVLMKNCDALIRVHQNLEQCQKQGSVTLRCDFHNTDETVVIGTELIDISTSSIESLHIHNVKTLSIPEQICVDMVFENIERIDLNKNVQCPKRLMTLKLVDSQINSVPRQLDRLELKRSRAERVVSDMGLRRLLISESVVGELKVPWPIGGDVTWKIEHSIIERFMELKLEAKAFLMVSNTTINYMPANSLTIGRDASANFWYSTITGSENSIVLKEGGKMGIKELSGVMYTTALKIGADDATGRRPPGVPQHKFPTNDEESNAESNNLQHKCQNKHTSLLMWLIPSLIATAEAFILIVWCGLSAKKPKSYKSSQSESQSDGPGVFNVQIDGVDPYANRNAQYYNPNNPNFYDNVRKR